MNGGGRRGPGGHAAMAAERGSKKRPFKETWGRLINFGSAYKVWVLIAALSATLGSVLTILGPDRLGEMTNLIVEGMTTTIDIEAVTQVGLTLVAFYAFSSLLTYTQGFIMATVTQKLSHRLRKEISEKINRLPLRYYDSTNTGDILSRVTNDVDTIGQTLNESLGGMITGITLLLGSTVMMFVTNWAMALVAILSSLVGLVLMMAILSRSQKHFSRQQKELGAANGHVEEAYTNHNVVLAYNGQSKARAEFVGINDKLYDSAWRSQFLGGLMMPLMTFVGNLGYVSVCIAGAALAIEGYIGFDVIVAFILYVRLFSQPLANLAQGANSLQRTAAANYRVFEFLAEEENSDECGKESKISNVRGDVEFKNVHFAYIADKPVIHDFSTKIKAGQKVAIVGPTGAGKTTMVNLLMRFYETLSGSISIDGVPISEMRRDEVRALFGMVLQDTWIFEGTILDNIVYNKKSVTQEELDEVCKAVGLYHFIRTLPMGYDTVLGDTVSLSGGQKQLVTIARAMLENAPMLILDEATSSVDTRTELLIQQAMDKLVKGRTSFVIAHRLSTIKNADVILVMDKGDIVESGTHEELLARDGFYAKLYNSQFES